MKTYTVRIEEDLVIAELEETAKAQRVVPEDLAAVLIAKAVAPQSRLAHRLGKDPQPQY